MRPATIQQYKSYAITVRPLDGATAAHDDLLCKFVKKYCEYYYIVSEKLDDERHLHCGVFLKKAISRSNMALMLKRQFKDMSAEEKRVLGQGLRIMYNIDFIENYLDKDDDTEEILKNLPEVQRLDAYWPPAKDQAKAQAAKAVDKYYANLEFLWNQHQPVSTELNYETVSCFLSRMMYSDRLIRVIRSDKDISQTAKHLLRYLSKSTSTVIPLAPWDTV